MAQGKRGEAARRAMAFLPPDGLSTVSIGVQVRALRSREFPGSPG